MLREGAEREAEREREGEGMFYKEHEDSTVCIRDCTNKNRFNLIKDSSFIG